MTTTLRPLIVLLATALSVLAAGPRGVIHFQVDPGRHAQQKRFKPQHPERGYVGNCRGGFYNVSWEPKEVGPADRISFYGHLVSPVDLDQIHLVGVLWYEGQHMVTINQRYSCQDLTQQLVSIFSQNVPHISCPIRKGQLLSGSFLFTDTEVLIGYDGDYDIHVKIKDAYDRDLMCIDVKFTVLPPDY